MLLRRALPLLLLSISLPAAAQKPGPVQGTAEIQSDKLKIDHALKRALFEGNVTAHWRELVLECDEMNVSYDEQGNITSLRAAGNVVVRRGEARATAKTARLDARQGLLVLNGNPVLVQGPHRLEGSRILVHLKSGRIEAIDAKGTFSLGNEAPR